MDRNLLRPRRCSWIAVKIRWWIERTKMMDGQMKTTTGQTIPVLRLVKMPSEIHKVVIVHLHHFIRLLLNFAGWANENDRWANENNDWTNDPPGLRLEKTLSEIHKVTIVHLHYFIRLLLNFQPDGQTKGTHEHDENQRVDKRMLCLYFIKNQLSF